MVLANKHNADEAKLSEVVIWCGTSLFRVATNRRAARLEVWFRS